jgi:hypothetical protein
VIGPQSTGFQTEEADRAGRRYLVRVVAAVALMAAALGGFNLLVDPLGLLRIATIAGVNNDRRPALEAGHRSIREFEILRRRPDTLILGTSRELYGIEPSEVARRHGGRVHNASIAAATLADFEGLLVGAGALVGARRIYIGLDYFSFDDRRLPAATYTNGVAPIAIRSARTFLRSVATLPALLQSFETISASRCRPEGEEFPEDGRRALEIALTPCGGPRQSVPTPVMAAGVVSLFDFESRATTMNVFERILRHCKSASLDCRPFIGPMHGVYLSALQEADWERYQSWKADLARIASRHEVNLLDLSSAFAASTRPFAQQPDHFYDTLHFGTTIGAAVLDSLDRAADSSDRLTPESNRLAVFRTRDETAIAAFKNSDPAFAEALTRAIRARPDSKRRE